MMRASLFTTAPVRNRPRLLLEAPVPEVWGLLGDLSRFPEYSAGLERVEFLKDAGGQPTGFVCHFRPEREGGQGIVDHNTLRWYEPNRGYASSGAPGNAFGLRNDLVEMVIEPASEGTLLTYRAYYDAEDLGMNRIGFDQAFADVGERLIARFGGRILERFVDAPAPVQP